jgi:methylenetetrahydrofolate dehydrogenase (NADP+) / methenyltetrahydrofolate cyclohydrolase
VGHVIDGRAYAAELMEALKDDVARLHGQVGIATVLVGDDYAAQLYQNRIDRHAQQAGLRSWMVRLPASSSLRDVVEAVGELERNPSVSGVLVLRPLPEHLNESQVFEALPRLKDVEAQHPENAGLLALGLPRFVPSTPAAAFHMLDRYMSEMGRDPHTAYDGLNLVLVGRSPNVGKPAAILGLARNATVVSAHKYTSDAGRLADFTRQADLLIVAVGVPGLVTGEMVRDGAIVVDIGINPVEGPDGRTHLVGDVDFESVEPRVEAISPVPGGVGPITDVWVLRNAVTAARVLPGR